MLQASLLALVAGYADAVGYLRLGAFAGMMTGNTILLALALAGPDPLAALAYAGILAAFFVGVILARLLQRAGVPPWGPLLGTAAMLVLCDLVHGSWAAPLLALGMGAQNAAATCFAGIALNTVFITGNLQKFGEGLVARLWPAPGGARAETRALAVYGLVWLGYAAGAGLGAVAEHLLTAPLVLPAMLLPFVLLRPPEPAR